MDGNLEESVVKVDDVEMLEKPNFDEGSFGEGNGTPSLAIPSDGAAIASAMATGGGGGTPTADEEGSDFRFTQSGRGGFRGRPSWGTGGGAPPRFRGRGGFGPPGSNSGPPMRPFFRGGRGGSGPPGSGGSNRFGTPNFDPNWGPPPGMMGGNPYGPPPLMMSGSGGSTNATNGQFANNTTAQQAELWVETKTEEGKSYYYHALSRETTWTRPEGSHIKIMSQSDVEALTIKNQQQQQQNQQQQQPAQQSNSAEKPEDTTKKELTPEAGATAAVIPPLLKPSNENGQATQSATNTAEPQAADSTTNLEGTTTIEEKKLPEPIIKPLMTPQPLIPSLQQLQTQPPPIQVHQHQPPSTQQQPPPQHQHHHPQHHQQMHYGGPPPQFGGPQYGMPPPGYGGYPSGPWGMPWQQQQQQQQAMAEQPAKNLILKPGVIEPQVIARAAEWSEHRAPDGRVYYYHAGRGESVWEKPQAIRDIEAARMAAHSGNTTQPPVQMPPGPVMTAMQINATPVITPQMQQIHQIQVQPHAIMFDPLGFTMKPQDIKMDESIEVKLEKKRKAEAEKKKKDDEERARQQAVKQMDKSRPISSTPIAGTPWCVVWTGDGRVFFYNPSSRTSVWERPEDLLGRPDVDKAINTMPEQLLAIMPKEEKPQIEIVMDTTSATAAASAAEASAAVTRRRTDSESSENGEDTPTKKVKLDTGSAIAVTKQPDKRMDIGKEAAIEAEVRAARERALVPLDIRVKSFKEMLKEKDVSAFSTWEKELHKIVFDPRYLLLTSRERKQVFEKYVKERAEEERREKRNKMRQKRDDFRALMEMANLHGKSGFSDFGQKYGKDDRFKGIEKMRERESLFNEFIVEVRRREKEDKVLKKEQIRKDFIALLREHSDIDRHSRWIDVKKKIDSDSRYRAVDNSMLREDYFLDFCKILKEEKKKIKEKERERKEKKEKEKRDREKDRHREKDRSSDKDKGEKDKSRDKHRDRKDSEKADGDRKDSDDRADEVEDGEKPDTSEDEAERQQRERDRQLRAEQSIKEREKEVQIQLAGHLRDRDKEREHHKRDEAMRHFSALLADLVRNADLTWKEVKKQLRKDHRWELVEQLEREDRERLFNDHIDQLSKKKRDKFREMLDEVPKLILSTAFKDVKKSIRDDPRYLKYSNSEKCEREFKDYIKDKTIEAKASFRELLQECKLITHKSFETVEENPTHFKEIEEILKNDKRYLVLEHLTYDRTQMLSTYLEDLHKRGPPPPPTASESTRRK